MKSVPFKNHDFNQNCLFFPISLVLVILMDIGGFCGLAFSHIGRLIADRIYMLQYFPGMLLLEGCWD